MLSDALVTACKLVRSVQTKALPSECHDSRQDPAGALYASYPAGALRSSYASPRHLPLRGRFSARGRSSSGRPTPACYQSQQAADLRAADPPRGRRPARPTPRAAAPRAADLPARSTSPRGRPPRAADPPRTAGPPRAADLKRAAKPPRMANPRARPVFRVRPTPPSCLMPVTECSRSPARG